MASSSAIQKTTASAKTEVQLPEDKVQVAPINRREFLFYVWGASIALFSAQTVGYIIWFLLPRFKEGEFGGTFTVEEIPAVGSNPVHYPEGKFWISNQEEGLLALYSVCTHLGCLYQWIDANDRFECPCHGSKFTKTGVFIEGPAPRSLDRFAVTVGGQTTDLEGNPLPVGEATGEIIVDTGNRIKRAGRI